MYSEQVKQSARKVGRLSLQLSEGPNLFRCFIHHPLTTTRHVIIVQTHFVTTLVCIIIITAPGHIIGGPHGTAELLLQIWRNNTNHLAQRPALVSPPLGISTQQLDRCHVSTLGHHQATRVVAEPTTTIHVTTFIPNTVFTLRRMRNVVFSMKWEFLNGPTNSTSCVLDLFSSWLRMLLHSCFSVTLASLLDNSARLQAARVSLRLSKSRSRTAALISSSRADTFDHASSRDACYSQQEELGLDMHNGSMNIAE
ncbi:cytosolic NADP+-dependent isocitratedehydrogenase [Striga asiatica]|uniref:Cytosolic NADP+-dependent isocitratedehydrogenase n=1 Tax=Striga asiatica TaxID=4170 RepID=A0A5A7PEQ5_STRAF|nr:cytosolic NADP+-dependent isocitratedehydrogenase [Striga asiatica]